MLKIRAVEANGAGAAFCSGADRHTPPPRVVLYSHDTLGFGHLRRNLLIARALRQCHARPDILLIAGMREAGAFEMPEGVDCVSLPAYAKGADGVYRARDLQSGVDALRALRASMIRAAVEAFSPDLMIVDNVPRGALFELDPTLKLLGKKKGTRLILGLRDVIDEPATVRRQWLRQRNIEALRNFYSAVWIYGDPALYDAAFEYGLGGDLAPRMTYTGYLDQRARLASPAAESVRRALVGDDPRPYVLCMVGGGRDGAALCQAFAGAQLPKGYRGILVTGTQMPKEERHRINAMAEARDDLEVLSFVREPIALHAGAAAVVAMGGYNTVTEVLSLGRPALIVPRAKPRAEQLIRAERLAARRLIDMLPLEALSPAAIGQWLAALPGRPARRGHATPDLRGLERVRELADAALGRPALNLRAG